MLLDGRSLDPDRGLRARVCIIGAGPAGLTLALELERAGVDTLLLESGGAGWTLRGKRLAGGENADDSYYRLAWTRVRAFGGTSWAWRLHTGLRARPLDDLDVAARPEIGRASWPLPVAELRRFERLAAERCQVPEVWGDPWPDPLGGIVGVRTVAYGIGPGDGFTSLRDDVAAMGHVRCVTDATVQELLTSEDGGRVTAARVATGPGRELTVEAETFVLAAGGIENARLLLLSRDHHASGLGNATDQVGRCFMEHPHVRTGVLRLDRPRDLGLLTGRDLPSGAALGFLRLAPEVLRRERLLASDWAIHPATDALTSAPGRALVDLEDTARSFLRVLPGTGRRIATALRRPGRAAAAVLGSRQVRTGARTTVVWRLLGMSEQLPDPASRVTLGDRRDPFGQPVARVDWRLGPELEHLQRTQLLLDASFRAAGIGRIEEPLGSEEPPALVGGGFHHMGTTRMSRSPRDGVVDPDGRVHGVANLHVAGSSVFPTSGVANPTLTLVALALRLAERLVRDRERSTPVDA